MTRRDENNFFSRRIADRGSDEIVFDSQDRVTQETDPKGVIWDEIVGKEGHPEDDDSCKILETHSLFIIRDENNGKEEHPEDGDIFYHSLPCFDKYGDEEIESCFRLLWGKKKMTWVLIGVEGRNTRQKERLKISSTMKEKDKLKCLCVLNIEGKGVTSLMHLPQSDYHIKYGHNKFLVEDIEPLIQLLVNKKVVSELMCGKFEDKEVPFCEDSVQNFMQLWRDRSVKLLKVIKEIKPTIRTFGMEISLSNLEDITESLYENMEVIVKREDLISQLPSNIHIVNIVDTIIYKRLYDNLVYSLNNLFNVLKTRGRVFFKEGEMEIEVGGVPSNPIDPGPIGLIGVHLKLTKATYEGILEERFVRILVVTVLRGRHWDVSFDPGGFNLKVKLEDEFFSKRERMMQELQMNI